MKKTGVISEVFPKMANVILDEDPSHKILCSYRRGQIVDRDAEWRERSPVSPGDKVQIHAYGSKDGVIEEVIPRVNSISRRAPGREGKLMHTIAANIDFVVITSALKDPDFSPGLIDRFLIATTAAQITPVIVINKMDLAESPNECPWQLYKDLGYRCYPISTINKTGIEELREEIKGKTSVFCGHSGVGKTSLLSQLFGEAVGKVGGMSASGKGKHTTTVSKLIPISDGTRFIDTPGIKEFGLIGVEAKNLIQYFPELYELQVKHESYDHLARYESYLRIKAALEDEGR